MSKIDFEKIDKIQVHFIVGSGRSGTTLLVHIFNEHKECMAVPEIKHLVFFYNKYRNVKIVTEKLIEDYRKYFWLIKSYKKLNCTLDQNDLLINLLSPGDEISYERLTKLMYLSFIEDKNKIDNIKFIVDKNPYYSFHMNIINDVFPRSSILMLQRDPRAFVSSNRQSQIPVKNVLSVSYYALAWNLFHNIKPAFKDALKFRFKVMNYEDMVSGKETYVKIICEFFNMPFDSGMFDFHLSVLKKIEKDKLTINQYERAKKRLSDLSSPINPESVNSWKINLSIQEIKKVDFLCGKKMIESTYTPLYNQFSLLQIIFFFISAIPANCRLICFKILDSPQLNHFLFIQQLKKEKRYLKRNQNVFTN